MENLLLERDFGLENLSRFNVTELDKEELSTTNGGVVLTGTAAVAAAVGGGLLVLAAGVLVGVAIYYGVKWLTS
ncbi:MAG TPA: class IIb bacteriocin, lactobin A/cerein 7B family [Balneolales bacterium]|nr:class IIb bacteriocin, lactobin A/cerein 7B family [Balneolales bacterium]